MLARANSAHARVLGDLHCCCAQSTASLPPTPSPVVLRQLVVAAAIVVRHVRARTCTNARPRPGPGPRATGCARPFRAACSSSTSSALPGPLSSRKMPHTSASRTWQTTSDASSDTVARSSASATRSLSRTRARARVALHKGRIAERSVEEGYVRRARGLIAVARALRHFVLFPGAVSKLVGVMHQLERHHEAQPFSLQVGSASPPHCPPNPDRAH